jgi:hypothetical protein
VNGLATRGLAALSVGVAGLAALAAATGLLARGDGSFISVTTVRGETFEMATSGVYAYNAQRVVAEGVGWDLMTLVGAVPALVVAAILVGRGSFRGRLLAMGLLGYFAYQYLEYAVTWAFGPLFLLFVAIYGLSLVGVAGLGTAIAVGGVDGRFGQPFPRRSWAVLSVGMSALLTVMWLGRIGSALRGDTAGVLLGETTMTVQALDLGLVVPISVGIAILAWRRSPIGYALASAWAITFVAMSAAITSMLLAAWAVEGSLEVVPVAIFGLATIAGSILAVRMYRSATPYAVPPVPQPEGRSEMRSVPVGG